MKNCCKISLRFWIGKMLSLIVGLICVLASSCGKDCDEDTPVYDGTIIFFFPYSPGVTSYLKRNVNDIEAALQQGAFANERLMVCIASSDSCADIIEIKENGRDTLLSYSDPDFSTSADITSMIDDIVKLSPTEKYSLVSGGHGTAWIPSDKPLLAKSFGGRNQTDIVTFAEAIENSGVTMQYILFDCCFMSNVETVYALRHAARYIVGCPTEIMMKGMPYQDCAKYISGTPDYDGFCRAFCDYYQNYDPQCGTIAVVDCMELDSLALIMKKINGGQTFDKSILDRVQRMDGYETPVFYDLGDYVTHFSKDEALSEVFMQQLAKTVPYKAHTGSFYSDHSGKIEITAFSGLTISPPTEYSISHGVLYTEWWQSVK